MELVYLWVEEYKNIHKQGFNFSGRYRCDYNPEKNELTIDENKDYIHIFPENINLTVIVGKNGSGKSSLLSNLPFPTSNLQTLQRVKNICVLKIENQLTLFSNIDHIVSAHKVHEFNTKNFEYFSLHHDLLSPDFIDDYAKYCLCDPTFHNHVLYEIYKDSNYSIDLHRYKSIINKLLYQYADLENLFSYHLKKIKIFRTFGNIKQELDLLRPSLEKETLENEFSSSPTNSYQYLLYFLNKYDQDIQTQFLIYIFLTIYRKEKKSIDMISILFNEPEMNFIDLKINIFHFIESNSNLDVFKKFIKNFDGYVELFEKEEIYDKKLDIKDLKVEMSDKLELLFDYEIQKIVYTDFYDDNDVEFKDLSQGERQIVSGALLIYDNILKIKNNNILILLDEPDLTLHPQWQKQYIHQLINIFDKIQMKYIQLIITSHSPFILSDIPKQNVIFLEQGKQVYPNIDTFGANIHTIVSHGFFMKDGLMGEFAKEKINTAITYLNQKELSKEELEYCENIITIVGEPILKKQLQRMLDSQKIQYLAKDTKEEIEFLKYRIDLLSKRL